MHIGSWIVCCTLVLLSGRALGQEEQKFAGWAADGRVVLSDANQEGLYLCKPGGLHAKSFNVEADCQACASKKACAATGKQKPATVSADGKVKLLSRIIKAEEGFKVDVAVLASDQARPAASTPHIVVAGTGDAVNKVKVKTYFRPDSRAVALEVCAIGEGYVETTLYAVDLGPLTGPPQTPLHP